MDLYCISGMPQQFQHIQLHQTLGQGCCKISSLFDLLPHMLQSTQTKFQSLTIPRQL